MFKLNHKVALVTGAATGIGAGNSSGSCETRR